MAQKPNKKRINQKNGNMSSRTIYLAVALGIGILLLVNMIVVHSPWWMYVLIEGSVAVLIYSILRGSSDSKIAKYGFWRTITGRTEETRGRGRIRR